MNNYISVVIPTSGRSAFLEDALESITKQSLNNDLFEVIVVENGSKDMTEDVVKNFQTKIPHLSYLYEKRPGLHHGRHAGYRAAKGDILVYADDDIIAFPTWLEGVYESFQDKDVVLVGGKDLPKYEGSVPFWVLEKWYQMYNKGHRMTDLSLIDLGNEIQEIPAFDVFGCNYAIRKTILDETRGFHPDGMPFSQIQYRGDGEWYVNTFISDKGYKVLYNPKASVYHRVPASRLTLDYFKKRAFCEGVELSYDEKRYNITTIATPIVPKNILQKIKLRVKELIRLARMSDIEKEILKSRRIGYEYHQYMYEHNEELRNWVHKECYM